MQDQTGIVELNGTEVDYVSGGEITVDEVISAVGGFFSWLGSVVRDIID